MQDVFDYIEDLKGDLSIKLPDTLYTLVEERIEKVLQHFIQTYMDSLEKMYTEAIEDIDKVKSHFEGENNV